MRGPRLRIATYIAMALGFSIAGGVACATLADISSGPSSPGANGPGDEDEDAGSLEPTEDGLVISPAMLTIEAPCGTPTDKSISINNVSDEAVSYEVSVPDGALIQLKDPVGTPGTSVKGTVAAKALVRIPATVTSTSPGSFDGEVVIKTKRSTRQLPTKLTVKGGALALVPSLVDFGEVPQNSDTPPQEIELENIGNEAVVVTSFAPPEGSAPSPDFAMATGSISIPAGQKGTVSAQFNSGLAGEQVSALLEPVTQSPLCTPPPNLELKGKRVDRSVTFTPGSVDFGNVDCNTSPTGAKPITVRNAGTQSANVTFTFPANTWFSVAPNGGSVPAGGQGTFDIRLNPVGPTTGVHTENISINVVGEETVSGTISARVNVEGMTVTLEPTKLTNVTTSGKTFVVQTTELVAAFTHSSSNPAFDLSRTPLLPRIVTVSLKAGASPPQSGEITTTKTLGPRLCNTLPTISVTTEAN